MLSMRRWLAPARFALAAGLAWGGLPDTARAAPPTSVERIAILAAANDGGQGREELLYAESDAYALAKVLRDVGGLSTAGEIQVYRATPRKIRAAVERANELAKAAKAKGKRLELIFYYSGHSDERGLLLGGARLSYKDLRAELDAIDADVRIAILDSCASGAFTRAKGGKRRPPFLMGSANEVEGHAFLTSSSAEETAQESDRIGGSFFTHFLVSGLRGAADRDGDRRVTLSEAYQFAYDETLEHTQTTSVGAQHAAYDIDLSGSGELVMTDLRKADARLTLSSEIRGRVWVRSSTGRLAAELVAPGDGTPVVLAVEPGRYTVTVEHEDRVRQASVSLGSRGEATVESHDLGRVPRERTTARGGVVEEDYVRVPVSIGLFPALSMGGRARPMIVNFGMAVLWSQTARVQGISMAFGADIVREHVRGVQWTGGAGVIRGRLSGAQLSTGFNWVTEDARGAQLSLVGNRAGRVYGLQGTILANSAGAVRGAQIGLVNVGGTVRGAQIGLINYAREADASVGLFSATREGGVHPEVWTSDVAAINVAARFGAKHTYSLLGVGFHPFGRGAGWRFGVGLGGRIPMTAQASLELDVAGWIAFVDPAFAASLSGIGTARIKLAWQLRPRLTIFGGPTFNFQYDKPRDGKPRLGYGWTVWRAIDREGDDRFAVWPGFAAGIRF